MNYANQTIIAGINGALPFFKKQDNIVIARYTDFSAINLNYPGFIVQKQENKYMLIPFYQTEIGKTEYSVTTGEVIHVFDHKPVLRECFQEYVNFFNEGEKVFSNKFLSDKGKEGEINLATVLPIGKEFALNCKIKEMENIINPKSEVLYKAKQKTLYVYTVS